MVHIYFRHVWIKIVLFINGKGDRNMNLIQLVVAWITGDYPMNNLLFICEKYKQKIQFAKQNHNHMKLTDLINY